jgi:hypothetical protein
VLTKANIKGIVQLLSASAKLLNTSAELIGDPFRRAPPVYIVTRAGPGCCTLLVVVSFSLVFAHLLRFSECKRRGSFLRRRRLLREAPQEWGAPQE